MGLSARSEGEGKYSRGKLWNYSYSILQKVTNNHDQFKVQWHHPKVNIHSINGGQIYVYFHHCIYVFNNCDTYMSWMLNECKVIVAMVFIYFRTTIAAMETKQLQSKPNVVLQCYHLCLKYLRV